MYYVRDRDGGFFLLWCVCKRKKVSPSEGRAVMIGWNPQAGQATGCERCGMPNSEAFGRPVERGGGFATIHVSHVVNTGMPVMESDLQGALFHACNLTGIRGALGDLRYRE